MSVGASLLSSLAVVTGPLLFFHGFRAWRIQRLIEDTPTARIRSMAMGLVELNGHVEHRSRLSAPFSGRECAYWEIDIATRASSRNGRQSWNTVHRAISGNPFYLRDATGVALVYPQGADVRTSFAVEETTHGLGVPPLYMEYMEAKGLGLRTLWSLGPMRFRERTLEQGAIVYALGRAQPKAMAQSLSDETVTEEALAATGTDAWVGRQLRDTDREVTGVLRRGEHDPAFLITSASEKNMTFEYGLKAFGGLFGGPALTLFGLWCVLELLKSHQYFVR